MDIKCVEEGDNLVVSIIGSIDMNNISYLKEYLGRAVNTDKKNLVIDMNEVTYIDSSGLGIFIVTLKKFQSRGGKFSLRNVSDQLKQIFVLTHLYDLFHFE